MSYKKVMNTLKEENYNNIVTSFEAMLFEHYNDPKKVSMNDLAKHANLTKRTLYKYFDSKDELLFEVMIRGYQEMHRHIETTLSKNRYPIQLENVAYAFYDFCKKHPDYYEIIMNYRTQAKDIEQPSDRALECYNLGQKSMEYITRAIQEGMENKVFRQDIDVIETTILVWSFATGILNILTQKSNYIRAYYHIDFDRFITRGFTELIGMLK